MRVPEKMYKAGRVCETICNNKIRISYSAVKDYLKEYGSIEITKEIFEAFKSWLYDDIHEWLKDNAKSFSENYK